MTQPTALEILKMMIEEFQQHSFSDIGAFTLPRLEKQYEFDDYELKHIYMDSSLAFNELLIQAQDPQLTHLTLRRLLDASHEYFTLARRIPKRFEQELSRLTSEAAPEIVMETMDEKEINLSETLDNGKIDEILRLILYLEENLSEETGDEFLNQLKL